MARANLTHKPGEKAPEPGAYRCTICVQQGIESTCEVKGGELFVACPLCLARNVPEWDMTWRPVAGARQATPWPGSLAPRR